jgi:hypothetical protein
VLTYCCAAEDRKLQGNDPGEAGATGVLRRETWAAPEYEPEPSLKAQASSDPGVGVPENV